MIDRSGSLPLPHLFHLPSIGTIHNTTSRLCLIVGNREGSGFSSSLQLFKHCIVFAFLFPSFISCCPPRIVLAHYRNRHHSGTFCYSRLPHKAIHTTACPRRTSQHNFNFTVSTSDRTGLGNTVDGNCTLAQPLIASFKDNPVGYLRAAGGVTSGPNHDVNFSRGTLDIAAHARSCPVT